MIPQLLVSLIGGPIVSSLLKGYRSKLEAANTSDRIASDLAIKDIEAGIEASAHAKKIRMATAGFWEMRLLTFAIAFPFVSHLWSVWLDTQFRLGWGIPKFPEPMNEWQGAILLSFFGIYTLGKTMQSLGTAIAMRKR
jgi:hypothetical protein